MLFTSARAEGGAVAAEITELELVAAVTAAHHE